jgi:hypothetical protein
MAYIDVFCLCAIAAAPMIPIILFAVRRVQPGARAVLGTESCYKL